MLNEEFSDENMKNVIAIPVDVNSLMAAFQLGYLTATDNLDLKDENKPTPESYRLICEAMSISPADNIEDLIGEMVSRNVGGLIKEKQERDNLN